MTWNAKAMIHTKGWIGGRHAGVEVERRHECAVDVVYRLGIVSGVFSIAA